MIKFKRSDRAIGQVLKANRIALENVAGSFESRDDILVAIKKITCEYCFRPTVINTAKRRRRFVCYSIRLDVLKPDDGRREAVQATGDPELARDDMKAAPQVARIGRLPLCLRGVGRETERSSPAVAFPFGGASIQEGVDRISITKLTKSRDQAGSPAINIIVPVSDPHHRAMMTLTPKSSNLRRSSSVMPSSVMKW